jgi:hypothetical protein
MEQHLKDGSCSEVMKSSQLNRFKVRKQLRRPGLKWASVSGFDVGSRLLGFLFYIESPQYLVEVPNADNKNVPTDWTRVSGLELLNCCGGFPTDILQHEEIHSIPYT